MTFSLSKSAEPEFWNSLDLPEKMAKYEKSFWVKSKGKTYPNVLQSTSPILYRGNVDNHHQVLLQNSNSKKAESSAILSRNSNRAKMEIAQRGDFERPSRNSFKNPITQSSFINSPKLPTPSHQANKDDSLREILAFLQQNKFLNPVVQLTSNLNKPKYMNSPVLSPNSHGAGKENSHREKFASHSQIAFEKHSSQLSSSLKRSESPPQNLFENSVIQSALNQHRVKIETFPDFGPNSRVAKKDLFTIQKSASPILAKFKSVQESYFNELGKLRKELIITSPKKSSSPTRAKLNNLPVVLPNSQGVKKGSLVHPVIQSSLSPTRAKLKNSSVVKPKSQGAKKTSFAKSVIHKSPSAMPEKFKNVEERYVNELEILRGELNHDQIVINSPDGMTQVPEIKPMLTQGKPNSTLTQKKPMTMRDPVVIPKKKTSITINSNQRVFWPIRASLFPNVPPFIKFASRNQKPNTLPPVARSHLKWLDDNMPPLIKTTVANTGFKFGDLFSTGADEWTGTWELPAKLPMFKPMRAQKVNHFPGEFYLTRKDYLWKNLHQMMTKHGTQIFGIIPYTYVLPRDLKALEQNWKHKDGSGGEKWIIKPPAGERGIGIKVINKWEQLPKVNTLVVQKYIDKPLLIKGNKFDIRLYVLVTSFDPLRIYIYSEGIVRFATVKYTNKDEDISNRCMHLTNCCINRESKQYRANNNPDSFEGHIWILKKLWEYLGTRGFNTKSIWKEVKQLAIKTIISGESSIVQQCAENMLNRYNCYQVFGFDVIFDNQLKPWLLEVNNLPSWEVTSAVDRYVKIPLIRTVLDMAQYHLPPQLTKEGNTPPCYDYRLYATKLHNSETHKHSYYTNVIERKEYLDPILERLTGDDVRILTQAEDELVVKGNFEKIFPTSKTYTYLDFMPTRYYNRLCDAWECRYRSNRQKGVDRLKKLCAEKLHLQVPLQSTANKHSPLPVSILKKPRMSNKMKCEIIVETEQINGDKTENKNQQKG